MITVKVLALRAKDTALPPKGNRARRFNLRALLLFTALIIAAPAQARAEAEGVNARPVSDAMIEGPGRVLKVLFPTMASYEARDLTWGRHGPRSPAMNPADFRKLLAFHLKGPLEPSLENAHTPFTFYKVAGAGGRALGVVVGSNQRWKRGALDVFVAFDVEKRIHDVFVQDALGVAVAPFRGVEYRRRFRRFSVDYLPDDAYLDPPSPLPALNELLAHQRVVRGVRLGLLLYRSLYLAEPEALSKVPTGL